MTQLAFIFPGQGSQSVGMLSDFKNQYSKIIKETFDEASTILNYDLWLLTQKGPITELNKTWHAQPALLTASVALWRIWKDKVDIMPAFMAGHSLGEYSALVCAGVISFTDAVRLVEIRGKLMQKAVPEGTGVMSAIVGLNYDKVAQACQKASKEQIVSPANYNSYDQIVISGHKEAVKRAIVICKSAGARYTLLPVSVPSHCILMKPVAEKISITLKTINFSTPKIPVVNNVDVQCETEPEIIRNALMRQLYNPVKWIDIIKYIASHDIKYFYEIGPNSILTKFTKKIVNSITALSINDLNGLSEAIISIKLRE